MGQLSVGIGVSHGGSGGSGGSGDDLGEMVDRAFDLQVHHNPGACGPCRANNNPALVPFPGCAGAKKAAMGARIEAQKAKKQGRKPKPKVVTGCRCTVVLVNA